MLVEVIDQIYHCLFAALSGLVEYKDKTGIMCWCCIVYILRNWWESEIKKKKNMNTHSIHKEEIMEQTDGDPYEQHSSFCAYIWSLLNEMVKCREVRVFNLPINLN